jgi:lipid II:glycine glycyltransferase (peptidoglycan interpeptide bridge formation enzyme)
MPVNGDLDVAEEKAFLNSAMAYFQSIKADMVIPATTNTVFRTTPDGAIAAPYGTWIINLALPEDTLWSNLHSKHRNVIRNAMKKDVEIKEGLEHMKTAFDLITDTLKRSKLSFMNYNEFERFVNDLKGNIKIITAYSSDGILQGCAVIPFSLHSAYYLYGGSIPAPLTGATNFLQWSAIRLFRDMGVKNYDFVGVRINPDKGSKQEGLLMFKQRFGGQLVQGYMWKYPFKPLKYNIYKLAVRRLRGGDIVDQEHHKLLII